MIFYLQYSQSEAREIIDSEPYGDAETKETIEARCWIDAKREFGFPLTALQEEMLTRR
jgi:hypothetical protein